VLEAPILGKNFTLIQGEREGVLVLVRPCIKASHVLRILPVLLLQGSIQDIYKTDLVDSNTGIRFEVM